MWSFGSEIWALHTYYLPLHLLNQIHVSTQSPLNWLSKHFRGNDTCLWIAFLLSRYEKIGKWATASYTFHLSIIPAILTKLWPSLLCLSTQDHIIKCASLPLFLRSRQAKPKRTSNCIEKVLLGSGQKVRWGEEEKRREVVVGVFIHPTLHQTLRRVSQKNLSCLYEPQPKETYRYTLRTKASRHVLQVHLFHTLVGCLGSPQRFGLD